MCQNNPDPSVLLQKDVLYLSAGPPGLTQVITTGRDLFLSSCAPPGKKEKNTLIALSTHTHPARGFITSNTLVFTIRHKYHIQSFLATKHSAMAIELENMKDYCQVGWQQNTEL